MLSPNRILLCLCFASGLICQSGCKLRFHSNAIQGSGIEQTQVREIGSFSTLNVSGVADVEVALGPATTLSITFDDNLIDLVETEVVDGELTVSTQGHFDSQLPLIVKITTPELNKATLSGVGSLDLAGIDNEHLEIRVSGVGSVTANGKVGELKVNLSGTGKANLDELVAQTASVSVSGVGNAKIHAIESINARTSGVGGVTIYGNPKKVDSSSSGVGSISMAE